MIFAKLCSGGDATDYDLVVACFREATLPLDERGAISSLQVSPLTILLFIILLTGKTIITLLSSHLILLHTLLAIY